MARKSKGAALYELLYRDKGKATNSAGSLKLPAWILAKGQAAKPQGPGQPVAAVPASVSAPAPASASAPASSAAPASPGKAGIGSSRPGQSGQPVQFAASPSRPPEAKAAAVKPVSAGPVPVELAKPQLPVVEVAAPRPAPVLAADSGKTGAAPVFLSAPVVTARPAPAGSSAVGATTVRSAAPAPPPVVASKPVFPWANPPWLKLEQGRVRLDVSNRAAAITAGVMLLLLLITFVVGRYSRRLPAAPAREVPDVKQAGGEKTFQGASRQKPDNRITHPSTAAGGREVASGQRGVETRSTGTIPPHTQPAEPRGRYVLVLVSGCGLDGANEVMKYLTAKGCDVEVKQSDRGSYSVRTKTPTDMPTAQKSIEEYCTLLGQLSHDKPHLIKPPTGNYRPYPAVVP